VNLRVDHVSFSYSSGVRALQDVSLRIAPGESVVFVGENGAGKTTLAKHLNGLLRPSEGRVLVGDWDTRDCTIARLATRVAYVFQNPDEQLFERTVRAEVAFGPRNLGRPPMEIDAAVQQALAEVGLVDVVDHHPYDLQPSQRRLVTLAAALAMDTPVLVLDEPTTGQDASGTERIGALLEALKTRGKTLVGISHDLDFCALHFDRMVVMSRGAILADGPTAAILGEFGLLAQAGVEAPPLVRLAAALGLPGAPRSMQGFIELYRQKRKPEELDHAHRTR
jgi:energy-coupling factor transport system ATP-binding protein